MTYKKNARFGFYRVGLNSTYLRFFLACLIFLFFCFSAGCSGSFDADEEQQLIYDLDAGDFSRVLNPSKALLAKIKKTQKGSLYYIGLHLKKTKSAKASARAFFEYSAENEEQPYKQLSLDELYNLSFSSKTKLKILDKTIANKTLPSKTISIAKEKRQKHLFLLKKIDKLEKPPAEYLASLKMDGDIAYFLKKNLFAKNGELKKNKASFPKGFLEINRARLLVFYGRFTEAWEIFSELLDSFEEYPYLQNRNILSELGRSALYGSKEYKKNAEIFETLLKTLKEKSSKREDFLTEKYIFAFYAARLNLKAGSKANSTRAAELFRLSANYAPTDRDFDASLWYVLDILKNKSFDLFFKELCKTAPYWKDGYNFENFVAYACMTLTEKQAIQDFKQFKNAIEQTNLVEAQARNSYILTRLDFINKKTLSKTEAAELYRQVYAQTHNFFYYKILSAYWLRVRNPSSGKFKKYARDENSFSEEDSLQIIEGLIRYKLYDEVYAKISSFYPRIEIEEAEKFAKILAENNCFADSMRLMLFALRTAGDEPNVNQLKLIYPRPHLKAVQKYAKEFAVPEYLLYGLIRSESFFRRTVVSHAGAIGLTQLMESTARDIANRFKLKSYDLNDPDTNIRLGAYYLADMIRRNNGNIMHALFSYNAGGTTVKRWKRKFPEFTDVSKNDLFLEALSYPETRGYGRNVFSAGAVYANLYYGKTYNEVVQEFFKFNR